MQTTKAILWITSIIFGIGCLISLPMVMMSPMIFDAPGSEKEKGLWVVLFSFLSFPVLSAISIFVSWAKYRNGSYTLALWLAFLPILSLIGITIGFLIVWLNNKN